MPQSPKQNPKQNFFDQKVAEGYDERNAKSAPIMENLHFLLRLVLQDLPSNASVLCVGVGTGADILGLARAFPGWHFTGVEPSAPMLDICRQRLQANGLSDRSELFHGYVSELPGEKKFDAVICLLVAHFLREETERQDFFREMAARLKPGGRLVNAEISYDLSLPDYPSMLEDWLALHKNMGAAAEGLANIPKVIRETLGVIPPEKTKEMMMRAGLIQPVEFFQSFLIRAWHARKKAANA